ncbi:MAG: hypothetical protein IH849_12060, partial [Acidobacteria bacterium]|nr:hypothetical protein [Acidobacteriota bacterium]
AVATGNDAAQTDPSRNQTSGEAAAGNDTTAEPETPAAAVSGSTSTPQALPQANAGNVEADPSAQAPPSPTATEQVAQAAAQQPQPAQPQAHIEEPALVAPPINSIVAVTSGEYEYVDLVNTWFESAFADQQFEVIDFPSSPYETLPEAARFHVVTTATLVSAQQLEYFGNVQTQYTVALTTRVTDLSNGVTVVGPENTTLRYTAITMEQNLEKATADLARSLAQELRRLIRAP